MALCRLAHAYFSNYVNLFINCLAGPKNHETVSYSKLFAYTILNTEFILHFRRKPFDLRSIILPYNMAIAILNAYIAIELFLPSIALNYNYLCEPCRVAYNPHELRVRILYIDLHFFKLLSYFIYF